MSKKPKNKELDEDGYVPMDPVLAKKNFWEARHKWFVDNYDRLLQEAIWLDRACGTNRALFFPDRPDKPKPRPKRNPWRGN
jgi:hypothetical protein